MKITVHVVSPRPRPPDAQAKTSPVAVAWTPPPTPPIDHYQKVKTLAVPVDPQATFAELWKETEQRFRKDFDTDQMATMHFSHLQDMQGGEITVTDTIRSLYREDDPASERQLYMYLEPLGSHSTSRGEPTAQQHGQAKRPRGDADGTEQASSKRLRQERSHDRTTAALQEPGTPISSREAGNEGRDEAGTNRRIHAFQRPRRDVLQTAPTPRVLADEVQVPSSQLSTVDPIECSPLSSQGLSPRRRNGHAAKKPHRPRNALQLLSNNGRASRTGLKKVDWSAAEDEILLNGIRNNWDSKRIATELARFGRTAGAVRARKRLLASREPSQTHATSLPALFSSQSSATPVETTDVPQATSSIPPSSRLQLPSSPAIVRRNSTPSVVAYVQLSPPPQAPSESSADPAGIAPQSSSEVSAESADSAGSGVHPIPASNPAPSGLGSGKLRVPVSHPTNASRLRQGPTRAEHTHKVSAQTGFARLSSPSALQTGAHGSDNQDQCLRSSKPNGLESVAASQTLDKEVHLDPETIKSAQVEHEVAQIEPEVTFPRREEDGFILRLLKRQRWRDALKLARGDEAEAHQIFMLDLNRENMLEAVVTGDEEEIDRLKAQRRRRERELADLQGLVPPTRRVPKLFSAPTREQPEHADADEEVIREDDWSTDDDHSRTNVPNEFDDDNDEGQHDYMSALEEAEGDERQAEVIVELDGPRVVELQDIPAPAANPLATSVRPPGSKRNRRGRRRMSKNTSSEWSHTRAASSPVESRVVPGITHATVGSDSVRDAAKMDPQLSVHSQASKLRKKKLTITPKKMISREEALAAHLAECKRQEAHFLADESDDDCSASNAS